MPTLNDSLVSSSARPLAIRVRPDISAKRQKYLGKSYWIVKDPVGLKYYRFQDEEYAILNMLDGKNSLDSIKDNFQKTFPPQKITLEELQHFIGSLHQSGLILTSVHDQGYQLYERSIVRKRKERLGAFTNILCIRFKGFDPERLLNAMYPFFAWIFHPATMFLSLVMMVSALLLVLTHFDTFYQKLPAFQQFFTPENGLWLAVVLGMTKVVHEFGHGLTCKHFGGECHEMGVMILVLTPCLYCNVSDSWMLPSKWRRAAIGFAGIFVEVWLASFATFLWWYSTPGLLNNICLNIMFISSVSTIIFNANPLLKYDGYYVLSDILEIPNLRQKASTILSRKAGEWFLGLEYPEDPFLPQRNQVIFAIYAVAAACYRWVVTFSIAMFLLQVFEPYGLKILGRIIVLMSLYGLLVMPLYKVCKFFYVPGRLEKVKKVRFYISLTVLLLGIAFLCFVPLPYRIFVPAEIQYDRGDTVYVVVDGAISRILVRPGEEVEKGQPLAVLENNDIELQISELIREQKQYESQLLTLRRLATVDPKANQQVPATEESLRAVNLQLEERRQDQSRLVIRATRAGRVVPAQLREKQEVEGMLPTWSGTPFDASNHGAFLREGDPFCLIGSHQEMKATLVVPQSEKDFVQVGQKVDVNLNEFPERVFTGEVREVAGQELKAVSPRLSNKNKGEVSTVTEKDGTEKPQTPSYKVDVPLDNSEELMQVGLTGQAKIHAKPQTSFQRLWRLVMETFNLKL
ncbi:MAG: HlyD family efflux transporter periplasmic adaptor subunit [Planctomycetia bacterium]|nr:HlyD family efflux transporter periplasmic adaptor subunit [Planctomycetia bacterium]